MALGAEEIEFDLWKTKDGVLVSCHDSTLERVSNGSGKIYDHTYAELLALDFGAKHGIRCNVFWADTPDEARRYFEMGIDTVLTNDYLTVYNAVEKDFLAKK